jgi:hypothetical protein
MYFSNGTINYPGFLSDDVESNEGLTECHGEL